MVSAGDCGAVGGGAGEIEQGGNRVGVDQQVVGVEEKGAGGGG